MKNFHPFHLTQLKLTLNLKTQMFFLHLKLNPFRFHQYDSNGEWNGNRKVLEKSKCMCNYEDDIEIRITNDTKRTTLVDDKHKVLVYSKSIFKDKLKKLRKKQNLGKTENFY